MYNLKTTIRIEKNIEKQQYICVIGADKDVQNNNMLSVTQFINMFILWKFHNMDFPKIPKVISHYKLYARFKKLLQGVLGFIRVSFLFSLPDIFQHVDVI